MKFKQYIPLATLLAITLMIGYVLGTYNVRPPVTSQQSPTETQWLNDDHLGDDHSELAYFNDSESQTAEVGRPENYDKLRKLVAFYRQLAEKEQAAVNNQPAGYYNRLTDYKETDKPLPAEDVAMEEAHIRLYVATFYLKEVYRSLDAEQCSRAEKELKPISFHLGIGEDDPNQHGFYNPEAEGAFRQSIFQTFQ